jgi:glyoxylase-like metal-dependent hydrolase (beta-lactamase superfamily II)
MKALSYRAWATVLLILAGAVAGSAQFNQAKTPTPSNDGMTSQIIKTGLFLISGNGSNSVLRLSASGLILVDGKPAASYTGLRARARKISDQPIRALILTGCDKSVTGTNQKFVDDGTHIIVQENARQNLDSCNLAGDEMTPALVTYGSEYPIRMGGAEAQVLHFGNAYSNRDTVVYFPNLKVVVVGDLFAAEPAPDFAAGGSLVGWGPVLEQILKLDFDTVVPSQGPVITRADLQAFKTKIDTMVARATGLVKQGVPKDRLMAQLKTDDLGWQPNFTGQQLDSFYAELSRSK